MRHLAIMLFVLAGCSQTAAPGEPHAAGTGPRGDRGAARDAGDCRPLDRLQVERAGTVVRDVAITDALRGPGSLRVASGRHGGERALPALALFGDHAASSLHVDRCDGAPMRIPRAALAAEPERYVLVANSRGELKLIDTVGDPLLPPSGLMTRKITRLALEP